MCHCLHKIFASNAMLNCWPSHLTAHKIQLDRNVLNSFKGLCTLSTGCIGSTIHTHSHIQLCWGQALTKGWIPEKCCQGMEEECKRHPRRHSNQTGNRERGREKKSRSRPRERSWEQRKRKMKRISPLRTALCSVTILPPPSRGRNGWNVFSVRSELCTEGYEHYICHACNNQ